MSISVSCDACDAEFTVGDAAAGKRLKCKQCGEAISVPRRGKQAFDDLDAEEDSDAEIEESRSRRRGNTSGKSRGKSSKRSSSSGLIGRLQDFEQSLAGRLLLMAAIAFYVLILLIGMVARSMWLFAIITLLVAGLIAVLSSRSHGARDARWMMRRGVTLLGLGAVPLFFLMIFGLSPRWRDQRVVDRANQIIREAKDIKLAKELGTTGGPRDLYPVSEVPIPEFIDPRVARRSPSGITFYDVKTKYTESEFDPGVTMELRLYMPDGDAPKGSLGCVLVAPAGSNLITGKPLDGEELGDEIDPYVRAGMAVVHFSLDGPVPDLSMASDLLISLSYRRFSVAGAGLVNARNAMEFVKRRVPEVDPTRIYIAGHSSAGTLALLFAEHEPTLRGCMAYAPATEPGADLRQLANDPQAARLLPNLATFIERSSPMTHVAQLKCPVFLFHGQGDTVTPFGQSVNFANAANNSGKSVTLSQVPDSDHYAAMATQGVPRAVEWLRTKFGEPTGKAAAPSTVTP